MTELHLSRQNRILIDYLNLGEWISSIELRNAFSRDYGGAQLASLTKRMSELRKLGLIESKMDEYHGCRCAFYRRIDKAPSTGFKIEQIGFGEPCVGLVIGNESNSEKSKKSNFCLPPYYFPTKNTEQLKLI